MKLNITNLQYNEEEWKIFEPTPKTTIQFFITNRCNKRCKSCFYGSQLDSSTDMTFIEYKDVLFGYLGDVDKIV